MVKKRNGYECLGSHCYPFSLLFWTWPCASFNSLLIILNVQDGVISLLSPESHYVFPLVPNFGTPCEVNNNKGARRHRVQSSRANGLLKRRIVLNGSFLRDVHSTPSWHKWSDFEHRPWCLAIPARTPPGQKSQFVHENKRLCTLRELSA